MNIIDVLGFVVPGYFTIVLLILLFGDDVYSNPFGLFVVPTTYSIVFLTEAFLVTGVVAGVVVHSMAIPFREIAQSLVKFKALKNPTEIMMKAGDTQFTELVSVTSKAHLTMNSSVSLLIIPLAKVLLSHAGLSHFSSNLIFPLCGFLILVGLLTFYQSVRYYKSLVGEFEALGSILGKPPQ
jgi:hypothetical protein